MGGSRVELKAFSADMQNLYEMLAFVRQEAEHAGFDPPYISKIELAIEEALVNIICHGYPESFGEPGFIDIECTMPIEGGIKITIRDQGIPYNPLEHKSSIAPHAPLDQRELGGYGIYFIMHLMDDINYQREEGANILTLIKYSMEKNF